MKIAFISSNDPCLPRVDSDGGGVTVRHYALELARLGHEVTYFTPRIKRADYKNLYLQRKSGAQKSNRVRFAKGFTVVRKSIRPAEDQIDKLSKTSFLGRIITSFLFAETFQTGELDKFDVCCFFYPATALGFMTLEIKSKKVLFPLLLSDEYMKYREVSDLYRNMELSLLKRMDLICSPSQAEKALMVKKGIAANKIKVVHRGFDPQFFPEMLRTRIDGSKKIIIACVGAVRPQKNQMMLVRLAQLLKKQGLEFVFWIIGEDGGIRNASSADYSSAMKKEINHLNLGNYFLFTGAISEQEVGRTLKKADIAVFPSISESYGKAALESICSGIPTVLCDDIPAYKEFARKGVNAIVARRSPEEFVAAIRRLIKDGSLYEKLSSSGLLLRRASTWEKASLELEKLLKSLG